MQTIDVTFIPLESLEDTNKLILEYGGTPLECVTLIKAPYVEREKGPGVWMKALQDNNYTWIFHGSAGRGHVNVPRDLKGSPFWNEQADVVVQKLQASFPANAGLRFCPTKTLKRQMWWDPVFMSEVLNAAQCPFNKITEYETKSQMKNEATSECAACPSHVQCSKYECCATVQVSRPPGAPRAPRASVFHTRPDTHGCCPARHPAAPAQHGHTRVACVGGAREAAPPCTHTGVRGGGEGVQEAEGVTISVMQSTHAQIAEYMSVYMCICPPVPGQEGSVTVESTEL